MAMEGDGPSALVFVNVVVAVAAPEYSVQRVPSYPPNPGPDDLI
jgi:hypothetical protein